MSPVPDFFLKAGDTASTISATLQDDNGDAVDLQNADVEFHMVPISGSGSPALTDTASNDQNGTGGDGSKGQVSYSWQAGDSDVSGWYIGEWQVTYADTSVQTFPNAGSILIQISPVVL